MYIVRKAYKDDFEKVYPLFRFFYNEKITKDQWKNLFEPMCKELNNDFFGYLLENIQTKDVDGFLGCIFSLRNINGQAHKICSFTSWVVKPDLKAQKMSFKLVDAAFELKGYDFQVLTPVKRKAIIKIERWGFQPYELKLKTILPFYVIFHKKFNILVNNEKIKPFLNLHETKVFDDHSFNNSFHILFYNNNESLYVIFKPTLFNKNILNSSMIYKLILKFWYKLFNKEIFKAKINLGFVHYISNVSLFNRNLNYVARVICERFCLKGLAVNQKDISKKAINIIDNDLNTFGLYKSETLNQEDFDTLYSEFILLDLDL